jgi:hypothetical protein
MHMLKHIRKHSAALLALLVLLFIYLSTLQSIPNGSEHYYMIDVGETQIVLNVWGTLHATGYPLYVMMSSALVGILRALGVSAAAAPAVTSLIWGMAALALLYLLAWRISGKAWLAALVVLAFGLARSIWIHQAIAEIYSFGTLITVGLLWLALWQPPLKHRLYWLALLGGIGIAHHRAVAMMIPALVSAALPDLHAQGRKLPRALLLCLLLGMVGFVPYAYLLIRANAGAAWVYGEPGTLAGLWDQFIGREAERFIGSPDTLAGIVSNFGMVTNVLMTDLTLPAILAGSIGLLVGLAQAKHRRTAGVLLLNAAAAYAFHGLLYTDILSALIIPVMMSLALGWLLLADALLDRLARAGARQWAVAIASVLLVILAGALFAQNRDFILSLTTDRTGEETIALAQDAPPDSALMLAWGPRHFAVGFARDVLGVRRDLRLVNHKVDFASVLAAMPLVTPEFTFYRQPAAWWAERLGAPVYLYAVAPRLISIETEPRRAPISDELTGVPALNCEANRLLLVVDWSSPVAPQQDLSVFVHLLDADGVLIAQDDRAAPVYGWRPLTTWAVGEQVRDIYTLPRLAEAVTIRYGLYTQNTDGSFRNDFEATIAVACGQ